MIVKVFSLIIIFYLSRFVSDNAIDFLCLIITLHSLPVFLKYNSLLRIRCFKIYGNIRYKNNSGIANAN